MLSTLFYLVCGAVLLAFAARRFRDFRREATQDRHSQTTRRHGLWAAGLALSGLMQFAHAFGLPDTSRYIIFATLTILFAAVLTKPWLPSHSR